MEIRVPWVGLDGRESVYSDERTRFVSIKRRNADLYVYETFLEVIKEFSRYEFTDRNGKFEEERVLSIYLQSIVNILKRKYSSEYCIVHDIQVRDVSNLVKHFGEAILPIYVPVPPAPPPPPPSTNNTTAPTRVPENDKNSESIPAVDPTGGFKIQGEETLATQTNQQDHEMLVDETETEHIDKNGKKCFEKTKERPSYVRTVMSALDYISETKTFDPNEYAQGMGAPHPPPPFDIASQYCLYLFVDIAYIRSLLWSLWYQNRGTLDAALRIRFTAPVLLQSPGLQSLLQTTATTSTSNQKTYVENVDTRIVRIYDNTSVESVSTNKISQKIRVMDGAERITKTFIRPLSNNNIWPPQTGKGQNNTRRLQCSTTNTINSSTWDDYVITRQQRATNMVDLMIGLVALEVGKIEAIIMEMWMRRHVSSSTPSQRPLNLAQLIGKIRVSRNSDRKILSATNTRALEMEACTSNSVDESFRRGLVGRTNYGLG